MPKQRKNWQHPHAQRVMTARIVVFILGLSFIIALLVIAGVGQPPR